MKRKVKLTVEITIETPYEDKKYIGVAEEMTAMHTKGCLLDNPDIDGFTITDVDVAAVSSKGVKEEEPTSDENGVFITPEILAKNFHNGCGIDWYDVYFVREDERDENDFVTKYIGIRDAHRYPNKARFAIVKDDCENVLDEVTYVHELQNVLKDLGIEREIII